METIQTTKNYTDLQLSLKEEIKACVLKLKEDRASHRALKEENKKLPTEKRVRVDPRPRNAYHLREKHVAASLLRGVEFERIERFEKLKESKFELSLRLRSISEYVEKHGTDAKNLEFAREEVKRRGEAVRSR